MNGESWALTDKGKEKGGEHKESKQYGKYIVWPENLDVNLTSTNPAKENTAKLITATAIGKHFELSANKTNFILSEIGWLEKSLKGWVVTVCSSLIAPDTLIRDNLSTIKVS